MKPEDLARANSFADFLSPMFRLNDYAVVQLAIEFAAHRQQSQGIRCPKCDNYYGGNATGADDICDCHMKT